MSNRLGLLLAVLCSVGTVSAADTRPIGVFDSGMGGLTVLEKLLTLDAFNNVTGVEEPDGVLDFAGERFVYFGDRANMPYGDYSAHNKTAFLQGLIVADADFLLNTAYAQDAADRAQTGRKDAAKAIVIACNTATAYGYDAVTNHLAARGKDVRVTGVVQAGVRATLDALGLKKGAACVPCTIGVMATPGTIASGVYARTIRQELALRGVQVDVAVCSQGCDGLAAAVEKGSPQAAVIACSNLQVIVAQAARTPRQPLKAVILGCTHFPFVQDALERAAPQVLFVDPALYTAKACFRSLCATRKRAPHASDRAMPVQAYVSVPASELPPACLTASGELTTAYKYGRTDVHADSSTRPVPLAVAVRGNWQGFIPFAKRIPSVTARLIPLETQGKGVYNFSSRK